MDIAKSFDFLVEQYGLTYTYQHFENCFNGAGSVYTYSYYNESGCFTIHHLPVRGELDFFYAKNFSNNRLDLCEEMLDITSVEKEIWNKRSKFLGITKPFFWLSDKKVLSALAEVIKSQIEKHGEFFGIKVTEVN